mgnify:CR=1 FL=1
MLTKHCRHALQRSRPAQARRMGAHRGLAAPGRSGRRRDKRRIGTSAAQDRRDRRHSGAAQILLCRTGRHSGVGVLKFPGTVLPALLAAHRRNHAGVVVVVVVAARQLCRVAAMLALHHCAEIVSVFTQYFCNLHFRLQDRASWVGGITRQSTRTAFSRRLFLR